MQGYCCRAAYKRDSSLNTQLVCGCGVGNWQSGITTGGAAATGALKPPKAAVFIVPDKLAKFGAIVAGVRGLLDLRRTLRHQFQWSLAGLIPTRLGLETLLLARVRFRTVTNVVWKVSFEC